MYSVVWNQSVCNFGKNVTLRNWSQGLSKSCYQSHIIHWRVFERIPKRFVKTIHSWFCETRIPWYSLIQSVSSMVVWSGSWWSTCYYPISFCRWCSDPCKYWNKSMAWCSPIISKGVLSRYSRFWSQEKTSATKSMALGMVLSTGQISRKIMHNGQPRTLGKIRSIIEKWQDIIHKSSPPDLSTKDLISDGGFSHLHHSHSWYHGAISENYAFDNRWREVK